MGIPKTKLKDKKSFGLIGMRERTNYLNGTLQVTGQKGKGTSVKLLVPLNPKGLK